MTRYMFLYKRTEVYALSCFICIRNTNCEIGWVMKHKPHFVCQKKPFLRNQYVTIIPWYLPRYGHTHDIHSVSQSCRVWGHTGTLPSTLQRYIEVSPKFRLRACLRMHKQLARYTYRGNGKKYLGRFWYLGTWVCFPMWYLDALVIPTHTRMHAQAHRRARTQLDTYTNTH